jgi:pyrimidine 5'-nucleotidase
MPFTTIFFDLDDTLYPSTTGLWEAIRGRMNQYMCERLGLPLEQALALRRTYFETYGTTLKGLQRHYGIDANDYLAYVHDLPLTSYLRPDPALQDILHSLNRRKWIFTNADKNHAQRVLEVLTLSNCFDGIIDVRAVQFTCKPEVDAYRRALSVAGESSPSTCVYLDDSPRNLKPAYDLGFYTILVGSDQSCPVAYHSISTAHNLREIMPELWDGNC